MPTFEVYDSKNQDRLLGSIMIDHAFPTPTLKVAFTRGFDHTRRGSDTCCFGMHSVSFEKSRRCRTLEESETRRVIEETTVLLTDAGLKVLMFLSKFSLPGETRTGAARRRYETHHSSRMSDTDLY